MLETSAPGVYVTEIDASEIVPSTTNSVAVYAGNFSKGQAGVYSRLTSVDDLIQLYGKPTNDNYNDWYQAYNFLQYASNLLLSRAVNTNGSAERTTGRYLDTTTITGYGLDAYGTSEYGVGDAKDYVIVDKVDNLKVGDVIGFSTNVVNAIDKSKTPRYYVVETFSITLNDVEYTAIKLDRALELPVSVTDGTTVNDWYLENSILYKINVHFNGSTEALSAGNSNKVDLVWKITNKRYKETINNQVVTTKKSTVYSIPMNVPKHLDNSPSVSNINETLDDVDSTTVKRIHTLAPQTTSNGGVLFDSNKQILNQADWDYKFDSVVFANNKSKLKFFSKTVGKTDSYYQISIALPSDFKANDKEHIGNHCTKYAQPGLSVDSFFEYAPALNSAQIAVFVYDPVEEEMKEKYLVSLDPNEVDGYNNSMFIENVINRQSNLIYVKCNTSTDPTVKVDAVHYDDNGTIISSTSVEKVTVPNIESYTLACDYEGNYYGSVLNFYCASDSEIQEDDLLDAFEIFENKEVLDIDIVIANELDNAVSAKNLAESRKDCIVFMGIPYEYNDKILAVGKRTAEATTNIVEYRNSINYNTMWISLVANYKYQYDRYNDTYRWINMAGDVAGLRAQSTENYATWWASAGLNRGQIKNVQKLAYAPNKTQIGTLYNNGINAIVTFPGQGTVLWGQKTMLDKASSFDRVNVRGLFNTIERALAKMSKYQIFELNDTFTRNKIISMINPYLETVKSDRGIQDFLVVCDTTNNTPDIISRNQLIVDIYIKPTYAVEFLNLRFINSGVNDFSTVVINA